MRLVPRTARRRTITNDRGGTSTDSRFSTCPDYLELHDVTILGLHEDAVRFLANAHDACIGSCEEYEGREGCGSSPAHALHMEHALFKFSTKADCMPSSHDGRFQSSYAGELLLADGRTSVIEDAIIKIPNGSPDACTLAALEAEKIAQLSGFRETLPFPCGYATLAINQMESPSPHGSEAECAAYAFDACGQTICNIQTNIRGDTLAEVLYERHPFDCATGDEGGSAASTFAPSTSKIKRFLARYYSCAAWADVDEDAHIPLYPLIDAIALPLLDDISALEREGWQHCDISPMNIICTPFRKRNGTETAHPEYRIVDFALMSRMDSPPNGYGTYPYAPSWLAEQGYARSCAGMDIRALCAMIWQLYGLSAEHPSDPFSIKRPSSRLVISVVESIVGEHSDFDVSRHPATILALQREIARFEERVLSAIRTVLVAPSDDLADAAHAAAACMTREAATLPSCIQAVCETATATQRSMAAENAPCILLGALALAALALPDPSLLFSLAIGHLGSFALISLGAALLATVLGFAIDTPMAWMRYRRTHPNTPLTWNRLARVAKYGDDACVVSGAGMFDPSAAAVTYATACNVLGALCTCSLLCTLATLPDIGAFVSEVGGLRLILGCSMFLSGFIAFKVTMGIQHLPRYPFQDPQRENPDNSLFTRAHVWGNIAHLVWTFALVMFFGIILFAYGIAQWGSVSTPPLLVWVVVQTGLFLAYSSLSSRARSVEAEAIGSLSPGLIGLGCAGLAIAWLLFAPTPAGLPASVSVSVVSLFYIALCILWRRRMKANPDTQIWVNRSSRGRLIVPILACCILICALACLTGLSGIAGM